ncbi:MAG: DUF2271 domain-containing protein [Bacteroidales bacterium]|nr:DUF2271 domain-containing protein [Bacteroidales bacterium]MCF8398487.1 DUF2271 domain-containing protein [Bacteroidales bacterium]
MKKRNLIFGILMFAGIYLQAQDTLWTNVGAEGIEVMLEFREEDEHNYPLMAIWIEDMDSNFMETLYVAQSIGTSVFRHGDASSGKWQPGTIRRPAALPYWSHQRGVKAKDGLYLPAPEEPVADAITGPTPPSDFVLISKSSNKLPDRFRILFEINQSWDWNEYWTNTKYPDDTEYKSSSQPSIIYEAVIDRNSQKQEYFMNPIGHGHYSGKDGKLYTDLSTLTTAKQIVERIVVKIEK